MRYQRTPATRRRVEGPKGGSTTCVLTVLQCEHHGQYTGHVVAKTRKPTQPCPECTADNEWYSKAAIAIWDETGARPAGAAVLARAEQMAGHQLKRYRHG